MFITDQRASLSKKKFIYQPDRYSKLNDFKVDQITARSSHQSLEPISTKLANIEIIKTDDQQRSHTNSLSLQQYQELKLKSLNASSAFISPQQSVINTQRSTLLIPEIQSFYQYKDSKRGLKKSIHNRETNSYTEHTLPNLSLFNQEFKNKSCMQVYEKKPKKEEIKLDFDQYLKSLPEYVSKKKASKAINKLLENNRLKPLELPTLKQMHQNALDERNQQKQLALKQIHISAFIFDMIVRQNQLDFDKLIYQYLDNQMVSRGFLYASPSVIMKQFVQDLQILQSILNSDKLVTVTLIKIPGIDLKLLKILFRRISNKELDKISIIDVIKDPQFSENYVYRNDIDQEYIIFRLLCGFGVPDEIFDNISSIIVSKKMEFSAAGITYRQGYHRKIQSDTMQLFGTPELVMKNLNLLQMDVEFFKRLVYFQNNLQLFLDNKQEDLKKNLEIQLSQYQSKSRVKLKRNTINLRSEKDILAPEGIDLLSKIKIAEKHFGSMDIISNKERYQSEKFNNFDKIFQEVKDTLEYHQ